VRRQLPGVSERRACRVLGQARATQRHPEVVADDEPCLVARMIALATQYGRYGYRRITGLLHGEGWTVNHKRVERLWRREGLKSAADCDSPTAPVSVVARSTGIMCGRTTL